MEVIVIILLEVGGLERVTWQGLSGNTQTSKKLGDDRLVVIIVSLNRSWLSRLFACLSFFGSLDNNNFADVISWRHGCCNALNGGSID